MNSKDFTQEINQPNGLIIWNEQDFPIPYDEFVLALLKKQTPDLMRLHCALGVCGEAGELADAIKKEIIYEKPLDIQNVNEECGDLLFYLQATMLQYNLTWDEVITHNYTKLSKRYAGLVYTDKAAQDRADKVPANG